MQQALIQAVEVLRSSQLKFADRSLDDLDGVNETEPIGINIRV